jgi:hypothetical protein
MFPKSMKVITSRRYALLLPHVLERSRVVPSWYRNHGPQRASGGKCGRADFSRDNNLQDRGQARDRAGIGRAELKMQVSVVQFRPWAPTLLFPGLRLPSPLWKTPEHSRAFWLRDLSLLPAGIRAFCWYFVGIKLRFGSRYQHAQRYSYPGREAPRNCLQA